MAGVVRGLLALFACESVRPSCASGVSGHSAPPATEGMERRERVSPDLTPFVLVIYYMFVLLAHASGTLPLSRNTARRVKKQQRQKPFSASPGAPPSHNLEAP